MKKYYEYCVRPTVFSLEGARPGEVKRSRPQRYHFFFVFARMVCAGSET